MSDISPGPSPISLSPTPPSTPSSYGFSYPQGGSALTSPGHTHSQTPSSPSLSSPPPLTGTLPKSRPTPKPPRQRPNLPPPRPPSGTSGLSPQPLDHATGLLDGLSPESMSTGKANRQTRWHANTEWEYFLWNASELAAVHESDSYVSFDVRVWYINCVTVRLKL